MNRHYYTEFVLFWAVLAVFIVYNAYVPVTDPVESNYALTAKEMLMSGDWLSPRIYGQFWFDKPVMIYWLIALSYKIFGIGAFAARLPAAIFSAGSVGFIYWFVNKLYNSRRAAGLAAVVLATSLEFWVLGRMIITDSVLFFFNSVALAAFYFGINTKQTRWFVMGYLACGLAVLTKGPIGLLLPGFILVVYGLISRRFAVLKQIFNWQGMAAFVLITVPWYLFMYQAHGKAFLDTFLGLHNYLRATVSEHPKDNVFYYYLILFPLSLLPWTGVFLKAFCKGFREFKTSQHFAYMMTWLIITIGFYTAMATKYPTYVFPAIFPAAVIIGRYLEKMIVDFRREWLWVSVPAVFLFAVIGIGVKRLSGEGNWYMLYSVILLSTAAIAILHYKRKFKHIPYLIGAAVISLSILLVSQGLTKYAELRSFHDEAQYLPLQDATIGYYGNYATSAVYYSGHKIWRVVNETEVREKESVWSGKYTMPTITLAQFMQYPAEGDTYIIMAPNNEADFISKLPQTLQLQPVWRGEKVLILKILP